MSDPASDCKYCGGDCPNQPEGSEHLCDGYAGDIDGLYGDTQSLLEAAAEKARALSATSTEVQEIMLVMLDAWRLYFLAHESLVPCIEECSEEDTERDMIMKIVVESMRETATKPFTTDDLIDGLTARCVAFIQEHAAPEGEGEDADPV